MLPGSLFLPPSYLYLFLLFAEIYICITELLSPLSRWRVCESSITALGAQATERVALGRARKYQREVGRAAGRGGGAERRLQQYVLFLLHVYIDGALKRLSVPGLSQPACSQ